MIRFKKIIALVSALTLMLSFMGCGAKEFTSENAKALVTEVLENVEFQQELTPLPETLLGTSYDLPEGVEAEAYSAGYPADRFALFSSDDVGKLADTAKLLEDKVKELIDTYSSYDTSQVPKLEKAIIETKGNYVIFIVTDDHEKAKSIVDKY